MPYSAEISRANPACFLFLVIQCMGMGFDMPGQEGQTKEDVAADAVNRIVSTLSQRCSSGMEVRDYFHIGILGFTTKGKLRMRGEPQINNYIAGTTPERPFLPISQVVEVAEIQERKVKEDYGGGEIVEVTRRMPVWLRRSKKSKNWDPMCAMLRFVERPLAEWICQHPDSFPPIVIIICDGWSTDGDPQEEARSIKNLRTKDGNVLLFTVHLSSSEEASPTHFPSREDGLPSLGEGTDDSKMMFRMTSVLPEDSRRQAASLGFPVDELSRGFVLNADAVALAQFLDIGTRGPSNLH